jgi:hypothetical protein
MSDERHGDDDSRGLSDEELTRKDMKYSPGSDRETSELQGAPDDSPATDDVPRERVGNLPGTGGPDDTGDVMPPDEERDEPL